MTTSIFHVSDFHFKNDYPCRARLKLLCDDIIKESQNRKSYLVFSGDLVYSGDDNLFGELLDDFFAPLEGYIEKFYLVPGNHDVQRVRTDYEQNKAFIADASQSYLYGSGSKLCLGSPFPLENHPLQNYLDFHDSVTSYKEDNFFGSYDSNNDFTVVGLNSAWLSCVHPDGQSDLGNLKVDPAVLDYFIERLPERAMKVCVLHHPLEWFAENVRQKVENRLTEHFDLVLFGHAHNPKNIAGKFNGGNCVFLHAPAIKSNDSLGNNAYSIVNFDSANKRFEVHYRAYSEPQEAFVVGEDFSKGGKKYPREEDQKYWEEQRNSTKSGLLQKFYHAIEKFDFSDWYDTHIIAKSKSNFNFIQPVVKPLKYVSDERQDTIAQKLNDILDESTIRQFVIGVQDSGLTTAAALAVKVICEQPVRFAKVPVYLSVKEMSINKSSFTSQATKASPSNFSLKEMTALCDQGGVTFIIDQIGLPETKKFNKILDILDKYFPKCHSILFCAIDGGFGTQDKSGDLKLSPLRDRIFEIQPLRLDEIRELIGIHRPKSRPEEVEDVLNNVISSFTLMDEHPYPSSVAVLLDTLKKIPDFRPLSRVKLIDRYVECLLGRFDLDDIREGEFNSTEKLNFLAYVAGYFATNMLSWVSESQWKDICANFSKDRLLDCPLGLLQEFDDKGILLARAECITFRADYLYSYFVAREMNLNRTVFERITGDDAFYTHHRELVFYGELESSDNEKLLIATHDRICALNKKIIEKYSQNNINLNAEWDALLKDSDEGVEDFFNKAAQDVQDAKPSQKSLDHARTGELNSVVRGRGVNKRHAPLEIQLEHEWYVAIRTYFQLVKHSTNLGAEAKLKHLAKAFESGELFMKTIAAKREYISTNVVTFHSGILYINPLAEIDLAKSKREFKYEVPRLFSRITTNLMANPLLAVALRKILDGGSEATRFLVRQLLLEMPGPDNGKAFVNDIASSGDLILQTCSLRELQTRYLGYSFNSERRDFYFKIIQKISNVRPFKGYLDTEELKKRRMLNDMKGNLGSSTKKPLA